MRGGVVFDFDGLLADTESAEYIAWSQVFAEQGQTLEMSEWSKCVGGGNPPLEVDQHLAELVPELNQQSAKVRAHALRDAQLLNLEPAPGADQIISILEANKIAFAIASSSRSLWVRGFLDKFGWNDRFPIVSTWDMVGAKKPDPATYLGACEKLGIDPAKSMAIEDSTNGILAAKRAGMRVIAVPNAVTQGFDLSQADYRFDSLADISEPFICGLLKL